MYQRSKKKTANQVSSLMDTSRYILRSKNDGKSKKGNALHVNVVDSIYTNTPGYLMPSKGEQYHLS